MIEGELSVPDGPRQREGSAGSVPLGNGEARRVRYVFLDIVGFSTGRTVEAQAHLVATLNDIVLSSVRFHGLDRGSVILLPTGDGMCIAVVRETAAFDVHLRLALDILERVDIANSKQADGMRKFSVRVGLNENTDNLLVDINGAQNVAGAGINLCQRIMSKANGGQILVGSLTYEVLQYREKYFGHWREFTTTVKHGLSMGMYQFTESGHPGLNIELPTAFKDPVEYETKSQSKLSRVEAYYFAHAERLRAAIETAGVRRSVIKASAVMVALHMMARDSRMTSGSGGWGPESRMLHDGGRTPPEKIFEYYEKQDIWVMHILIDWLSNELSHRLPYFEGDGRHLVILNESGVKKVQEEWPDVCKEVGLSAQAPTESVPKESTTANPLGREAAGPE